MMPEYHIGTLDAPSLKLLNALPEDGCSESDAPRSVFLQSKAWTKGILYGKSVISSDIRIFRFNLEHAEHAVGLPIGQHLMMRLRDPVTREVIIRLEWAWLEQRLSAVLLS